MRRPAALLTDGSNTFARFSMQVRVPAIVREVVARNRDYAEAQRSDLLRLAEEIEADAQLPAPGASAPDVEPWSSAHAERAGESWLRGQWFHAELAVYREIASRCGFWHTDRDPFAPAKEEELSGARLGTILEAALACGSTVEERLSHRLLACLWGNRVDLSYAVAADRATQADDLLIDESGAIVPRLAAARSVHVVADNAATELALDLALVDAMLERPGTAVTLHLKAQPVFVSDALARDVERLLGALEERGGEARAMAARLGEARANGRLVLAPHLFWSGPRFLWQAPDELARALASADVLLLKGDANYRRVVGDAVWPGSGSFADAAAYVNAAVVCVRTLKSDALAGVPDEMVRSLDAREPRWRIDGSRGLVQASFRTASAP